MIFEIEKPTIIKIVGKNKRNIMVEALCSCGNLFVARRSNINSGHTKSCGCLCENFAHLFAVTHGLTNHPLHTIFENVRQRCNNPKNDNYCSYGERGITVCKEWQNDFKAFYDWAIAAGWKKGLQIDRRNNDEGYSPDNCRIVTPKVNARNKRTNHNIELNGEIKTVTEWCEELGLNRNSVYYRLKNWPVEKALAK